MKDFRKKTGKSFGGSKIMLIFAASKLTCGAETAGITSSLFCTPTYRINGLTTPSRESGQRPGVTACKYLTARSVVFVRENRTEQQYFCQLQVSNKFRKSMDSLEAELLVWMAERLVHGSASLQTVQTAVKCVKGKVEIINQQRTGGPYLTVTYSPLRHDESGFIRIERTTGRHQSVLLPIIDYQGEVSLE